MMKRLLYILLIAIVSLPMFAATELDSLFLNAVYNRDYESMSRYAELGADINIQPKGRYSLLHHFATIDAVEGIDWCIKHHMDVNIKDSLGITPLMYAAITGYSSICSTLIKNGADTKILSPYGMTAADYAEFYSYTALAAYINKPTTIVPHDFYQYRREVAKAARYADYKKAKKVANEALRFAKKELGPKNKYNVYLLIDLARVCEQAEDYKSQEKYLNDALVHAEKYSPQSEQYIYVKIAQSLVDLYLNEPGIPDSLMYYYELSERFVSPEARWWAIIGCVMGGIKEGYIREAETILFQALDDALYLAQDDYEYYSDFAITTLSLILDCATKINDTEALGNAEMIVSHLRSFIPDRHDYVAAMARVRIGHYYRFIGQGGLAKIWYQRASEDFEKTVGKNHNSYIQNLFNIGTEEMQRGLNDTALIYFYEAKDALEKKGNMDSYTGASIEQSIAVCTFVLHLKNPTEYSIPKDAEKLFLGAWEKYHKYTSNTDINVAILAENIALYYTCIKSYEKARWYAHEATSRIEQLIGKNNQIYLNAALTCITLEAHAQNYEKVDTLIGEYIELSSNIVNEQFLVMPETNREDLWESVYGNSLRQFIPSIILKSIELQPSLSKALYNCTLFSKGILLHTTNEIQSRLRELHISEIDQYLDAIMYCKKRLYEIEQAHPDEYPDEWGQLVRDIDGMESVALNLGRKYQNNLILDRVSWEDIKKNLSENQAAIEILRFDYGDPADHYDSIYYVATIITPNSEIPQYVYLCEESELSSLINESNKDNIYSYGRNGQQLAELIWGKLIPHIGAAKTIYFSPDGLLCQLSVEALPLSKDSVYGDAYDIVRCSSTKYILQQHKDEQPTQVNLFGGIQYDMTSKEMSVQSNALAMRDAYRGEMPDSLTRGHYEELAGAKEEVYSIARLLNKADINGRLYTGSNACEEAFKALSGTRPNVLHIATHGFFWPEEEASRKDYFMASFMPGGQSTSRYVSAMERAGLLFAGANVAMTGHRDELPSNVEDGVLSAQEISTMDLYGTDLVVLSACETGQGDIEGDGVYGLQRAFKLAGVQTIIMSLWKVNDAATQMLMTEFYTNWITNKMSKRKAFESAKQKVRAKYPEPSCWAGFIMLD